MIPRSCGSVTRMRNSFKLLLEPYTKIRHCLVAGSAGPGAGPPFRWHQCEFECASGRLTTSANACTRMLAVFHNMCLGSWILGFMDLLPQNELQFLCWTFQYEGKGASSSSSHMQLLHL